MSNSKTVSNDRVFSKSDFSKRLAKALEIRNMKPSDIAKNTGLSHALISQYLSGKFVAKSDKIILLAKGLNINELYLAGYSDDINPNSNKQTKQMQNIKVTFTKNLKHYLSINNINAHELSSNLNIPYTTVLDWLNGKTFPRPSSLQCISNYFNISAHELLYTNMNKATADLIKELLQNEAVSKEIGYDLNKLDEEKIDDTVKVIVSLLKLTLI